MKMCEQILKKRQRPNTIQILWIVKYQEKANNSSSYRCASIKSNGNPSIIHKALNLVNSLKKQKSKKNYSIFYAVRAF